MSERPEITEYISTYIEFDPVPRPWSMPPEIQRALAALLWTDPYSDSASDSGAPLSA